jgi:Prealbumin-like fold domain/Adenylate and Guanylate cyclase catalytic domain
MVVVAELPTGTVTFLFTDIEGSTKLLRELGDDYAGTLERHRDVLRAAFGCHGGIEVDTQGDAFFVAFARASDALAAAEQAQRELEIPVRMGIHVGEPQLSDGGYVGTLVTPGGYTVSEKAASGTSLSNYASSITCTKNGSSDKSGPGTSLAVSVASGDVEACTITNVRK